MFKSIILISSVSLLLSGCLYKMDIRQGNILEDRYVEQLKVGMSKSEVIQLIGSPQLIDPFHNQRWDYFSSTKTKNEKEHTQSIVTLVFDDKTLSQIIR